MQTNVKTPIEVFTMPQQLVIPVFQRPYVWKQEEQWEPLWHDVRSLAEAQLDTHGVLPTHFLGAIVVQADAGQLGTLPTSNVIDGQQRLTTLQLLMDAAAAALDDAGLATQADQLETLTHNQAAFVQSAGGSRLKLRHLNRDRTAFEQVMESDTANGSTTTASSRIGEAHAFFSASVASWLGETAEPDAAAQRGQALVNALTRGLQLVVIDLSVGENAQAIFETLNARGTPLTATDLIKNLVFQRLIAEGGGLDSHAAAWPFDTAFWEKEVSAGRYLIARSSLFLNQWLISRIGEEVGTPSTFSRFKRYVESAKAAPMSELLALITADAKHYEQWTVRAATPDVRLNAPETAFYRMAASGVELLKPLVIRLYAQDREVPTVVADQLTAVFESWLIRRLVLRLPTSDMSRVVADLIRLAEDTPVEQLGRRLIGHLSNLNVASTYWPGDAEIRQALLVQPTYRRYPRARLRMLLEALEDHYRAATHEPRVPRSGFPIEHILPQAWAENWPVQDLAAEQRRDARVHRLGNLTLVTRTLNSKVSNGGWSEKRKSFAAHTTFLLTRPLWDDPANAEWDEERIDARTVALSDAVLAVWPVPEGHLGLVVDPKNTVHDEVQLRDLLAAHVVETGAELMPRPGAWGDLRATVTEDGRLIVEGQTFETPSGAGRHLRKKSTNGWAFWRLPDGRSLIDLRNEYRAIMAKDAGPH